jgi:hypothetical protein
MSESYSERGHLPEPKVIKKTLPAVVQIVALQKGFFGNLSPAWTGSGTIIDARGIILTNCHVVNPRAMGMSSPAAHHLGIAITNRSDEPPALTYLAEIVAQSAKLDLAVLKITHELNGQPVRHLNLPAVPIGDSDHLELADTMAIFGYPGIGGETVTFTSGSVSGFSKQKNVSSRRAWIKTDATIAGGNSGGTAINFHGELIGIPTQAAAGTGITPVDARPVVDTNRDGRIDHRDTPMAIGGFINGLRPINLAIPLLQKAGLTPHANQAAKPKKSAPTPRPKASPRPRREPAPSPPRLGGTEGGRGKPRFSNLLFSSQITRDGRPINSNEILPAKIKKLYASLNFEKMRKGQEWGQVWAHNGKTIYSEENKWNDQSKGRTVLAISNKGGLADGEYHLAVTVEKEIVAEGAVVVGRRINDRDSQISGQLINEYTGRGIPQALIIALKPSVRVMDFVRRQNKEMAFTSARTDGQGKFTFPKQLPKGQAYGLVVVARGYQDLAIEGALRVSSQAPEYAQLNPIAMKAE